jgi:hypothetical protein
LKKKSIKKEQKTLEPTRLNRKTCDMSDVTVITS